MTRRSPVPRAGRQPRGGSAVSTGQRGRQGPSRRAAPRRSETSRARSGRGDVPASAARVRIVVADNQAMDRAGIVGLLETVESFEIVGEAATVEDSIERCLALEPDVLVLTLNLP